jgi:hypothetical protein
MILRLPANRACAPHAGAIPQLEVARPTARTLAASVVFVSDDDQPTSSSSVLPAVSQRRPSSTSAPRVMGRSLATSAATSAVLLDVGLDPAHCAPIAMRRWRSPICSAIFAPLRLQEGGDQLNPTAIDNDIASNGIADITPLGITETPVRFEPNSLYAFHRFGCTNSP